MLRCARYLSNALFYYVRFDHGDPLQNAIERSQLLVPERTDVISRNAVDVYEGPEVLRHTTTSAGYWIPDFVRTERS